MNIITDSDEQSLYAFVKWYLHIRGYRSAVKVFCMISKEEIDNFLVKLAQNQDIVYYFFKNYKLNDYIEERAATMAVPVINIAFHIFELSYGGKDEQFFAAQRYKAVEFTLMHDDGAHPEGVLQADVIIIGVSRTAKTPLCLLLANQGYRAINIPLIPEVEIPKALWEIDRQKIIGITVSSGLLCGIRAERLQQMSLFETVNYAYQERILSELEFADMIMKRLGCMVIDISHQALEETAQKIVSILKKRSEKR